VITARYHSYHAAVHISEAAVAAVVTISIAGSSYAVFNTDMLKRRTEVVVNTANCRAVDTAVVGYVGDHGVAPTSIDQVAPYVRGDVSAYRLLNGHAAGPGCPAGTRPG
jgi:hypothetical protein